MDKVYQVFISSTYADLAEERRRVSETLSKAGYIPSGMELFPATDQQQLDFIKRVIDRCDYYVVIIGGRYGSLADDSVSFTEKEYDYALSRGIPVLAFLHENPERIAVGRTDKDEEKAKKLRAFRDRLAKGRIVDFWTEPQELCTKVVIAVVNATNLTAGVGWVRGDQAIDPKVLQELERLRIENAAQARQLSDANITEVNFPDNLPSPDDKVEIHIHAANHLKKANYEYTCETTWKELFLNAIDLIIREAKETEINNQLAGFYLSEADSEVGPIHDCSIDRDEFKRIRFQLEALGLIQAISRQFQYNTGPISHIVWTITNKGRRYMSQNLAISKRDSRADATA
jgi:hypothetical protein